MLSTWENGQGCIVLPFAHIAYGIKNSALLIVKSRTGNANIFNKEKYFGENVQLSLVLSIYKWANI